MVENINSTIETLLNRRSCRQYKSDIPSLSLLKKVAEAGLYAPSSLGKQASKIIIITNKEKRDFLSALATKQRKAKYDVFYGAPAIMLVLVDENQKNCLYDGSLVMGNMMNAAYSLGLATCWIHYGKEVMETEEGRLFLKQLKIDNNWSGVAFCIIGYAQEPYPKASKRKEDRLYIVD